MSTSPSTTTPETVNAADLPTHGEGVEADDIGVISIIAVGLISTALVLASALGVKALFNLYQAEETYQKVTEATFSASETAIREQQNRLNAYREVDKAAGVYAIPIDRAMTLVVDQMRVEQQTGDSE